MNRRKPLHQGGRDRDPHAAAQLAHQIEQAGAVGDLAHRQVRQGQVRERDEDQPEPHTPEDERPEEVAHTAVGGEVGVLPHRQGEDRHAGEDGQARVELARGAAHRGHRERARQRAREDDESGLLRREVLQVLEVDRQHEDGGVETDPQHPAEHDSHRQLAALQDPQVHDRVLRRELVPHEGDERHGADDGVRRDLARVEPVEPLAALQHDLERADAGRQQQQPDVIDALGLLLKPRVLDEAERERQRQHADGNVDVEDPWPAERVGDVAAERGPQRRPHHHPHAEDRHRRPELLARELLVQDRLRGGEQRATAQALDDPPEDQRKERVRVAAEERRHDEDRDRSREVAPSPKVRRQPAGDRQDDHVRHDVAGGHPGDLVQRGAQIPHHVRDRHVHDAGVQQLEHGRQRYRDRDDVLVLVAVGVGGCSERR